MQIEVNRSIQETGLTDVLALDKMEMSEIR